MEVTTCTVKCQSQWYTVRVHELGGVESVLVDGGNYYGRFCGYRIEEHKPNFVLVGINHLVEPKMSEDRRDKLKAWMPKRGLLEVIDILCGRSVLGDECFRFVPITGLDVDPQKVDMRFFRRRCRYDVLRVIHQRLLSPSGDLGICLGDVVASPHLTRIYEATDLKSAMRYWAEEDLLTHGTLDLKFQINDLRDEEIDALVNDYDWEESEQSATTKPSEVACDVFICHASEDQDDFVRSLAKALDESGLSVWYDESTFTLGDSIRRTIDDGLTRARFGVVVLSPNFFKKEWPQRELDGLAVKESAGRKVILPIWHNVDRKYVASKSPTLADRFAVTSERPLAEIVEAIKSAMAG